MAIIKDNDKFGWKADGIHFDGSRTHAPYFLRYGPNGDLIKPNVYCINRERNGSHVYIGIVAQETTGKWFYVLPNCEAISMSDESFGSRADAVEALSARVNDRGLIRNQH